jgi:hypothetical protein
MAKTAAVKQLPTHEGAIDSAPIVASWDDVPDFATEAEEAHFWDTHQLGEGLFTDHADFVQASDSFLPPVRPRPAPLAVRLDPNTVARLKALAPRRKKGYQTLLKEFVMERLYEEEKREGIIGLPRVSET